MFFETTYVPSPQLSATSTLEEEHDDITPVPLSPSLGTVPVDDTYCSDEALSESPVDHLIFVIHASKNPDFFFIFFLLLSSHYKST
ncbi:hypothetical protein BDC45DRAFT_127952 [Circinella umbellata]|nr:hypothetical protein BDC45DRAFT_127952 [Circinella umbellata]